MSVTITINKGAAAKILWMFFGLCALILLFLGANLMALSTWSREARLATNALDERRLENRQAWKALGVDGLELQDHDISELVKELRKKYPLEDEK